MPGPTKFVGGCIPFAANPACQRVRRGADTGGRSFFAKEICGPGVGPARPMRGPNQGR